MNKTVLIVPTRAIDPVFNKLRDICSFTVLNTESEHQADHVEKLILLAGKIVVYFNTPPGSSLIPLIASPLYMRYRRETPPPQFEILYSMSLRPSKASLEQLMEETRSAYLSNMFEDRLSEDTRGYYAKAFASATAEPILLRDHKEIGRPYLTPHYQHIPTRTHAFIEDEE